MKRSHGWSLAVVGLVGLAAVALWLWSRMCVGPPAPRPVEDRALDPELQALVERDAGRVDARPGDAQRRYELGLVYHANELYELASLCFTQAAAQRPRQPLLWYHLAHCRERLGDLDGASQAMAQAAGLSEGYAPIHWRLAMWRADLGDVEGARQAARAALAIDPQAIPAHLVLASLAASEGSLDEGVEIIARQRLTEGRGAAWAHRILLEVAQRRGDPQAVARHSRDAGERSAFYALDPWLGDLAGLRTGLAYRSRQAGRLVRAGRYDEAIPMLLTLLDEAPEDARTMNLLGSCYLRTQRRGEAIEQFQRAAVSDPQYIGSFINLVTALLATRGPTADDLGRAEAAALRAVELDAASAAAAFAVGEVRRAQGRDQEALASYRRAFALDGRSTVALLRAGRLLLEHQEWTAALQLYTTAIEREPQHAEGWAGRALAFLGLGRLDEAAADVTAASQAEAPAPDLLRHAQALLARARSAAAASNPGPSAS